MNFLRYPSFTELVKLAEEHRRDIFISLIILVGLESVWFITTTGTFLELDLSNSTHVFMLALIVIVHVGLALPIFFCGIFLLLSFIKPQKIIEEKKALKKARINPPLLYQISHLRQSFEHYYRSTNRTILTMQQLDNILKTPGLRDGINPLFEKLTIDDVQEGLNEMESKSYIVVDGQQIELQPKFISTFRS